MFASLLVGLDGSPDARAALDAAIALGRRFASTIVVAAVVDVRVLEAPLLEGAGTGWPEALMGTPAASLELGAVLHERADRLIAEGAERVRAAGLAVQTARAMGLVEEELLALAESTEALVVGRRGDLRGGDALGAHTVKLVRRAPRPVVVAGGAGSDFGHPVVAYDGGETSSAALTLAARYAAAAAVPLDIVHVSEGDEGLLAKAEAFLSRTSVTCQTHLLSGDVVEAIAGFVNRTGADAVVCGAHHGGRRRRSWSIGSHTEALLSATAVPTIVVR